VNCHKEESCLSTRMLHALSLFNNQREFQKQVWRREVNSYFFLSFVLSVKNNDSCHVPPPNFQEIRTPLSSVIGMAELLQETSARMTRMQCELVRTIQQSTKQLMGIIDDLLCLSKVRLWCLVDSYVGRQLRSSLVFVLLLVSTVS
jgi:signal transduction histidine kinase